MPILIDAAQRAPDWEDHSHDEGYLRSFGEKFTPGVRAANTTRTRGQGKNLCGLKKFGVLMLKSRGRPLKKPRLPGKKREGGLKNGEKVSSGVAVSRKTVNGTFAGGVGDKDIHQTGQGNSKEGVAGLGTGGAMAEPTCGWEFSGTFYTEREEGR